MSGNELFSCYPGCISFLCNSNKELFLFWGKMGHDILEYQLILQNIVGDSGAYLPHRAFRSLPDKHESFVECLLEIEGITGEQVVERGDSCIVLTPPFSFHHGAYELLIFHFGDRLQAYCGDAFVEGA